MQKQLKVSILNWIMEQCGGIRISDHNGKVKYKYKFNVIKGYRGPQKVNDKGYKRLYYNYENMDKLISDVEIERKNKILRYGVMAYKDYMKRNSKNDLYKSFHKVA